MPVGFGKSTVTLAAATAQRLSDLLVAEGYTGSMIGAFMELSPLALTDVYYGNDSTVSATTGRKMDDPISRQGFFGRAVDPGSMWLFSTAGGDIEVSFEPL